MAQFLENWSVLAHVERSAARLLVDGERNECSAQGIWALPRDILRAQSQHFDRMLWLAFFLEPWGATLQMFHGRRRKTTLLAHLSQPQQFST